MLPRDAWVAAVGAEHVVVDPAVERATYATAQRVPLVLRPGDVPEVQACLRIAHAAGVKVHPVSGGTNWGLGSRVPGRDGAVLLDLGRLDRVLGHDEQLGTLRVQAGVSFEAAHRYLLARGSRLMLEVTGGSPGGSLVANALERGHGLGWYGERWGTLCHLEVVLADGSLLRTGFGRFDGAERLAEVQRWGVGPVLDGLFSQSGWGVVTAATCWLAPRPRHYAPFSFSTSRLGETVEVLRELRLAGVRASFRLLDDVRLMSMARRCPTAPLGSARREQLRAELGLAPFTGRGLVDGATAAILEAQVACVRASLATCVDAMEFNDDWRTRPAQAAGALGVPGTGALALPYWRKAEVGTDPDRDGCGLYWLCPALPWTGADAERLVAIVERVTAEHGFERNLGLLFPGERAIEATVAVGYDRDVPGEDERADACVRALQAELQAAGFLPARLATHHTLAGEPITEAVIEALRGVLDPGSILSPRQST